MKLKNYIRITAEDQSKLFKAILEFANLYADSFFTDEIKVSRISSEKNLYVVQFPKEPDFERFKYFVNYLHYPEVKDAGLKTKGFWTIHDQDELPTEFIGARVMLYVSENDKEYDNVYSAFDTIPENYKLGFAVGEEFIKLTSSEPDFSEMLIEDSDLELIKIITPDTATLEKRNTSKKQGCLGLLPFILIIIGIIYAL